MSVTHKQSDFQNVAAGATAVISRLDMGDTCDSLIMKLGGTTMTKALIDELRVKLATKDIVRISGSQLDTINQYMQRTASAAYLALHFADPNARTIQGKNIGGIDTSIGYSGFSIEADINAGAVAPELDCWMRKSAPKPNESEFKNVFRAYLESSQFFGSANRFSMDVPVGSDFGNLVARVHFFHANLTQVDVKKGGLELQGNGENGLIQFNQNELRRTTQAGHLAYDPLETDDQSDMVATLNAEGRSANFNVFGTFSAADTVNMVGEVYTTIERV